MEKMNLLPAVDLKKEYVIVAFGAHPDDIELGCAGTLMRIREELGDCLQMWYIVFSHGSKEGKPPFRDERGREAWKAAEKLGVPPNHRRIFAYRDSFFPTYWGSIKDLMLSLRKEIGEDRATHILTHHTNDLHQDHRTVAENTWRIFRDHLILEYEIVKYEGDLATPNFYVDLGDDDQYADEKLRLLTCCFESREKAKEKAKQEGRKEHLWWDKRLFRGHMRLRGVEANCIYAEGFHVKKLVW